MKKLLLLPIILSICGFNPPVFGVDEIDHTQPETLQALVGLKLNDIQPMLEVSEVWYDARLITPGAHVYLKSEDGYGVLQMEEL